MITMVYCILCLLVCFWFFDFVFEGGFYLLFGVMFSWVLVGLYIWF